MLSKNTPEIFYWPSRTLPCPQFPLILSALLWILQVEASQASLDENSGYLQEECSVILSLHSFGCFVVFFKSKCTEESSWHRAVDLAMITVKLLWSWILKILSTASCVWVVIDSCASVSPWHIFNPRSKIFYYDYLQSPILSKCSELSRGEEPKYNF